MATFIGSVGYDGTDINDAGTVTGLADDASGNLLYYDGVNLTIKAGVADASSPVFLSEGGDLLTSSSTVKRLSFNADGSQTVTNLGTFGGAFAVIYGLNARGDIIGERGAGGVNIPYIYNFKTGALDLGVGSIISAAGYGGPSNFTYLVGINNSRELIGYANGVGVLIGDGLAYGVSRWIPDNIKVAYTGFATDAAINDYGDIAGTLQSTPTNSDSGQLPFLLRRQYTVGDQIAPPTAAIDPLTNKAYQPPAVTALDGTDGTVTAQSYTWSDREQKLFFFRPISVKVTWITTADLTSQNPPPPVTRNLRLVWPSNPQIHVAGAPVNADPVDPASPYRAVAVKYSASTNPYDTTTKAFAASQPGYSVIHYVLAPALAPGALVPDPSNYDNYFQVVKTVTWDDPAATSTQPATVATKVADPRGNTGSPKTGYTIFANAPYDGVGPNRAYDRVTQSGPIIPVNINRGASDALVVAFYKPNSLTKVDWADKPVAFNIAWPANPLSLAIANPEGSGPLSAVQYPDKLIYNQPDPPLAGYNPNEEHAFFAPGSSGDALFALRNDLNGPKTSTNGVILKWHDPVTGEWVMRVYQVNLTDSLHPRFLSFFDAGQELPPPYPLSLIPLCADLSAVFSGDAFKDYNGKFYAKAGPGAGAKNPEVVIHYYYKLQPGFFYDSSGDGVNDGVPGQCVPWKTGSGVPSPVDVTFRIRWPDDAPTLQLGETLLTSKRGLPSITNFANAQIAFDSLNPDGTMPLASSARLYDPLSARKLKLTDVTGITAGYHFPAEIALQTVGGTQVFSGLPFVLRSRLSYDPVNKTLIFTGSIDSSVAGEPLLLTNVMSSMERDRIKQLSTEASFQSIVDALYDLTRNPNGVNVARPGQTPPDKALLIGFTTKYVTAAGTFYGAKPTGTITSTTIVQEPLGALPKALTAGLPSTALTASFGKALNFNGNGYVTTRSSPRDAFPLTVTAWIKTAANGFQSGIVSQGTGYNLQLTGGHVHATYDGTSANFTDLDGGAVNDNVWHHLALTVDEVGGKLYVDGVLKTQHAWVGTPIPTAASDSPIIGSYLTNYIGLIDEVTVWNVAQNLGDIQANRNRQLFGGEPGLVNYWRFDETSGNMALDSAGQSDGTLTQVVTRVPSTIPIPTGTEAPRYLVIAENNDPALGGLPVTLHVIQVGGALFRGDVKVVFPDNVFDERLTLRHSSDFGGNPDLIDFEWWYHPDTSDFIPTALPTADANGVVTNTNGWIQYRPSTKGLNSITLGEGGDSSLFVLQDNWFVMRYKGYTLNGQTNWGPWVGDPASTTLTRAAFAPGWIKRVIEGINPFEQRTKDFRQNAVNTYSSLLISAGQRYEGPIALNASGSNLNSVGLIEAYTTVLERGESLSIDSGVDSDPANNALLLAASRVSDLYTILGNEAYADAADPTIGFDTAGQFGTGAPSIFAFQNQLDSLLDEELALLRGRDDSAAGVGAAPVYNRLFWNFTGSDGEVAYVQTYNVSDQTRDGTINEFDARIMFPQGHGDAWGHYLTSLTNYYKLLRHPNFTWIPRPETTLIAGVAVQVDFLDERKFAKAAAAKARTGAQIVDLTYRLNYVEDPNGQYQGYKDTNADRAWGVTEWARRAGQGAFLDYVTANTILPAQDPNPAHLGIQKIDRTTVSELDEIIAQHRAVQEQIDKADAGLNPLGIAPGAVPFDIDPSKVLSGQTHFDQIYSRAVAGVTNSLSLFNFANQLTQLLRRTQDTQDQMANNTNDKERDFKNRMIEVFGYPYGGDIGAAGTYPSGYDGPDLYHYMYVDPTELTGEPGTLQTTQIGFFKGIDKVKDVTDAATGTQGALVQGESVKVFPADVGDPSVITLAQGQTFSVTYPFSTGDYGLVAPVSYGSRRAVGKLQTNLSDLLRAEAKLKQSATKYDLLLDQIDDQVAVLEAQFGFNAARIGIKSGEFGVLTTLSAFKVGAKAVQIAGKRAAEITKGVTFAIGEGVPKVIGLATDALSAVRAGVSVAGTVITNGFGVVADAGELTEYGLGQAEGLTKNSVALSLEVESQKPDVLQKVKALEQLVRSEVQLRYELFDLKEGVRQASANYLATLAQAQRLTEERIAFRRNVAATTQTARYNDATFRIFQNDALQKYRAQFDLAARYVYLAAKAYDYETCLLGGGSSSGQKFLTDIVRQRTLGQIVGGFPVSGSVGLADPLARLGQNFDVYRGQLGFNNPETETGRFSLRQELFRTRVPASGQPDADAAANWKQVLESSRVADLWQVPEFRKYCRPFAPESAGAQPGLVIPFNTTVTFGLNYFGWPLGGSDSAYDSSRFATKVRSAGVWFVKYNLAGLSNTPRVYLVPAGDDIMRSPSGTGQDIRTFSVIDQKLPVPFPIGSTDLSNRAWIPQNDTLGEDFGGIRRFSSFRAYHDSGSFTAAETIQDCRLIGRSVWNTRWLLIIPGGTFLNDPDEGLQTFINSNTDIKIFFQTYSYSGN